jgi:hypothetical protein
LPRIDRRCDHDTRLEAAPTRLLRFDTASCRGLYRVKLRFSRYYVRRLVLRCGLIAMMWRNRLERALTVVFDPRILDIGAFN